MCDWLRPESVPFPNVWKKFKGRKEKNLVHKTYIIRDATEEYYEDIRNYMITYFLNEEPTCKYLKTSEDPDFITELKGFWAWCLEFKLTQICLTQEENVKPQLAGFIFLFRYIPDDADLDIKNDKWKKILNIMEFISSQNDPFKKFGISEYLSDMGLLVKPEFRGEGIAENLLNTCELLCKAFNFPATIMSFTSINSQTLAVKLGFQDLFAITYEKLREIDEEKYGIDHIEEHTKSVRYMYKFYK